MRSALSLHLDHEDMGVELPAHNKAYHILGFCATCCFHLLKIPLSPLQPHQLNGSEKLPKLLE